MGKNAKKVKNEKAKTETRIVYDCCYDPCCCGFYWRDVCC
jgi:hypothetical protein